MFENLQKKQDPFKHPPPVPDHHGNYTKKLRNGKTRGSFRELAPPVAPPDEDEQEADEEMEEDIEDIVMRQL